MDNTLVSIVGRERERERDPVKFCNLNDTLTLSGATWDRGVR